MSARRLRGWQWVHRWSSLVCTVFLLVLCLTGLPLVFRDEIADAARGNGAVPAEASEHAPRADLDAMVEAARGPAGRFPGQVVRWVSLEDDRPEVWIALAPAYEADRALDRVLKFNAHTGLPLPPASQSTPGRPTLTGVLLRLHKDLLLGLPGELFLGAMALLVLLATVSGAVLYGPYMRSLTFGTVRRQRGARVRWLDLHNLLGVSTLVWLLVVSATGAMNEVADPLYDRWRAAALADALRPYQGQAMPTQLASVQAATDAVAQAMPGMRIRSVRYPDSELGSPHHYLVWAIGGSPLTSRLFTPALADARTGALVLLPAPPWYLTALQLSRPLHFGDYGGLPLKIIWALLDLSTIVVLGSGLYLWFTRRKANAAHIEKLARVHTDAKRAPTDAGSRE